MRIRVEYCAARGESGNYVKSYLSRSFVSPLNFEETLVSLFQHYGVSKMSRDVLAKLRTQVRVAQRRSKADLPQEIGIEQIMAKRRHIAKSARRFKPKELLAVFERVPLRDFNTYRPLFQSYLVRYLAHRDEKARSLLRGYGLQWKTYTPGKAATLFGGKKGAKARI